MIQMMLAMSLTNVLVFAAGVLGGVLFQPILVKLIKAVNRQKP